MTALKVTCDVCTTEFNLNPHSFRSVFIEPFGKAHYFECPACKHRYLYMIEDKEQHAYNSEIDYLHNKIQLRRKRHKEVSNFLLNRFKKLCEESKHHQTVLMNKYKKVVTDQLNQSEIETNSLTGKEDTT